MNVRSIIWLVLVALLGFEALGQASSVNSIQGLIQKVDSHYAQTKDFQAEFSQETQVQGFDTRLSSSGRVLLKKPGLLRWDYSEPSIEQIFVDGDQVLVYVPQHKQVIKANLTQIAASKAPLALLQGAGKLAEQFDVLPTKQEDRREGELPMITLVPKPHEKEASPLNRIVLEIEPQSYLIKTMNLYEVSGNVSTLRFSNMQVNKGIDSAQLRLDVPEDVIFVDAPSIQ